MVPGPADTVVSMRVRDVLDFFAHCPVCGYAAQATAVERELIDGRTEVIIQVGCALPCGWQDRPRLIPARDRARLS